MTMASLRKAAVCIIFAFFLSSGAVISAFLDFGEKYGYSIMRLTVPLTVIMLMAALINYRVLIPRFLLRGNYASYGICAFMLAYAVPLAGIGFERVVREQLGLPHRIMDYSSPWILADALSSCVLIIALLAGMSIIVLYCRWKEQTYEAISLEKRLNDNIAMMKSRLNPGYITASLTRITDLFHTDAEKANTEIRRLSDFLRHQLYELPMPDSTAVYPATETEGKIAPVRGRIVRFHLYGDDGHGQKRHEYSDSSRIAPFMPTSQEIGEQHIYVCVSYDVEHQIERQHSIAPSQGKLRHVWRVEK